VVDDAKLGNDARFPALGLDLGHLVVGHSDQGFCFGIKDGIKRAGRNGKILVWQRIIAGFDPSRPSHRCFGNRTLVRGFIPSERPSALAKSAGKAVGHWPHQVGKERALSSFDEYVGIGRKFSTLSRVSFSLRRTRTTNEFLLTAASCSPVRRMP
jgi:hypothetical protein